MPESIYIWFVIGAFAAGWFAAVSSGAVFAYIVFRTKKEQHEQLFPAHRQPKHRGPIIRDEFAADAAGGDDESTLPDVVRKMNARMAADMAVQSLKQRGESN